jgi:hypothetical protein
MIYLPAAHHREAVPWLEALTTRHAGRASINNLLFYMIIWCPRGDLNPHALLGH